MRMRRLLALLLAVLLLACAAGALAVDDGRYDLDDYGYRTVSVKGRGALVFQKAPGGKALPGHRFYDGDRIYVNLYWRRDGYAMAYEDGEYGYVDASYIDWGEGGGSGAKDLDDYEYRRVVINGSGALVFQRSPRGEVIPGYRYYDGDRIYVNVEWQRDGYAMAYEDGVYGYVDAGYIDWDSGRSSRGADVPSGAKDLDDYEYRRVVINGGGALVFQEAPRGEVIPGYRYYDGDRIYVNMDWRKNGYAVAYEDGVYGYVDASYIDW